MDIKIIKVTASNYDAENRLEERFLAKLQDVLDEGGQVVSITADERRLKKAFVLVKDAVDWKEAGTVHPKVR